MIYKNTKTGATFSSPCFVKGGDWIDVTDAPKEDVEELETNEQDAEMQNEKGTEDDLPEITKKQIMQELDAFGVKYDSKANKQELYALMLEQGR
jgi:hypothetical protein